MYPAILFVVVITLVVALGDAFSTMSPVLKMPRLASKPTSALQMVSNLEERATEEMVTLRSLNVVVEEKPFGMVLEELGDGVGVFAAECDTEGAAYAAGLREGDVLAALDDDETIMQCSLDDALELLASASTPISMKIYRELEQAAALGTKGGGTVKMAPRRLPSTKKLLKASTNVKFWQDPLMIGSAVLTVAMPIGIFAASSMIGK